MAKTINLPIIDPDSIAKEKGDSSSVGDISAGRVAIERIEQLIGAKESFIAESTLSGKSYLKILSRAGEAGYRRELVYLSLENMAQAILRVQSRVQEGGHHIKTEDICRRYERSFQNLGKAIDLVDRTKIFLNSTSKFSRVATIRNQEVKLFKALDELPKELRFLENEQDRSKDLSL